jgi:hypothetical protein
MIETELVNVKVPRATWERLQRMRIDRRAPAR